MSSDLATTLDQYFPAPVDTSVYAWAWQPRIELVEDFGRSAEPNILTFEAQEFEKAIQAYSRLAENWDGYGALPFQSSTLKNCLSAARMFCRELPSPELSPNSNGTVSLEWESASGDAVLEIGSTNFSFFCRSTGEQAVYAQGEIDDLLGSQLPTLVRDKLYLEQTSTWTVSGVNG